MNQGLATSTLLSGCVLFLRTSRFVLSLKCHVNEASFSRQILYIFYFFHECQRTPKLVGRLVSGIHKCDSAKFIPVIWKFDLTHPLLIVIHSDKGHESANNRYFRRQHVERSPNTTTDIRHDVQRAQALDMCEMV